MLKHEEKHKNEQMIKAWLKQCDVVTQRDLCAWLLGTRSSLAKTAEPIKTPFGGPTRAGSRNSIYRIDKYLDTLLANQTARKEGVATDYPQNRNRRTSDFPSYY